MVSAHLFSSMLIANTQAQPAPPLRAAMPDARLAQLLEQANQPDAPLQAAVLTPELARDGLATLTRTFCGDGPQAARELDATLPGAGGHRIPIRLYDPAPERDLPVCLYLHGGGHAAGSIAVYDPICRQLAQAAQCRVISVDYRLAPEHPYPQGLDDCAQVLVSLPAWLASQGYGMPGGLTVAGDSGGGALTASLVAMQGAQAAKTQAAKSPAATTPIARQILIYPSLDYTMRHPSMEENGSGYLLDARRIRWYFDQYLPQGADRTAASPLYMGAANVPPTLLFTAGFCPLRDEAYAYAQRLREAGTPCTHWHLPGMIHAFMNLHALVPDACEAVYREMAGFIRGG